MFAVQHKMPEALAQARCTVGAGHWTKRTGPGRFGTGLILGLKSAQVQPGNVAQLGPGGDCSGSVPGFTTSGGDALSAVRVQCVHNATIWASGRSRNPYFVVLWASLLFGSRY